MDAATSGYVSISAQAFRRLPHYYNYLKELRRKGVSVISSPAIARDLRLNEVQVRKDMAAVSPTRGKPKAGFPVDELLRGIERCLGYDNIHEAVLVGAGQIGSALLLYGGFREYGIEIVAAFDSDPARVGQSIGGKSVFAADRLSELCGRLHVHIGIITVPAQSAQPVCDQLVAGGVLAVWNFAPVHLQVPEHILVQNENMALSLALLSRHLGESFSAPNHTERGAVPSTCSR